MSGVEKPNNIRSVLQQTLKPLKSKIAIATSGGIDSASLVMAAKDLDKKQTVVISNILRFKFFTSNIAIRPE